MLTYVKDSLFSVFSTMEIVDVIDIAIVSIAIYWILIFVRETRAAQLLKGIVIIVIVLIVLRQFDLKVVNMMSDTFFSVGIVAIIVMLQPELRRLLERMGRTNVVKSIAFNLENNPSDEKTRTSIAIENITKACEKLSRTATGALIVIERQTKLGEQIDTGVILSAVPSVEIFCNIFFPNTPLHDGAVIIRGGIVYAAGCFLPKPQNEEQISKDLGTRHRAAIGISEVSDAVVVVVSEETGIISVAVNGVLTRGYDTVKLNDTLYELILPSELTPKPLNKKKTKKAKIAKKSKTNNKEEDLANEKSD